MGGASSASCDWSDPHLPGREGGQACEGCAEEGAQRPLCDWLAAEGTGSCFNDWQAVDSRRKLPWLRLLAS